MTGHGSAGRRRGSARVLVALLALVAALLSVPGAASADVPAAPTGLSPNSDTGAASDTKAQTDLLLTWAPVPGAASYEVQVSDDPSFDPNVLSGTSTTTSWALPATVPAGDYVWRVRGVTPDGPGDWSTAASFTHSWESAPADVRVVAHSGVPTVSWDPMPGASFYEVEFSANPYDVSGAMSAVDDADRWTCYTEHTTLTPYGAAVGQEALPGDEKACTFASQANDPRQVEYKKDYDACQDNPKCISAAQDKRSNTSPMAANVFFSYSEDLTVPAAARVKTPMTWYVRVRGRNGTPSTAAQPFPAAGVSCTGVWTNADGKVDTTTVPGLTLISVPIPSKVPTYLGVPECSSWSGGVATTLDSWEADTTPAAITSAPASASVAPLSGNVLTATPVFSWSPVAGAAKYRVYVGRTRDIRSADHVWETTATTLSPYGTLPNATKLYWAVQACGYQLCGSVNVMSFSKSATSPVAALSATSTPVDLSLSWHTQTDGTLNGLVPQTDAEARAYEVQVDLVGSTWTKPAIDVTVDAARTALDGPDVSRTTLPLAGLADGTYAWRVRAVDESGFGYPWSYGKPFLRDVTVPTVKIGLAQGFDQAAPFTVTYSEAVSVPAGSLRVLAADGSRVPGQLTGGGATWTFTPTSPWTTGATYTFSVVGGVDPGGHAVVPASLSLRASTIAQSDGPAVTSTGAWTTVAASDALAGAYQRAAAAASLKTTVVGTYVRVYACRSPRSGKVAISVDGKQIKTVDLYRSYSGCGSVFAMMVKKGSHTVAVSPTGTKNPRSKGTLVGVDAITTV